MTTAEWITVGAILLGPIAAVTTQLSFQKRHEKQQQKFWVFSTLMSLRGSALSPEYVRALNYIDVVFFENKTVRLRWEQLLASLETQTTDAPEVIGERRRDLTAQLIAEIAKDLDYKFDHTHIKNQGYYPEGLANAEHESTHLRQLGIALLKGESSVKVALSESESTGNAAGRR